MDDEVLACGTVALLAFGAAFAAPARWPWFTVSGVLTVATCAGCFNFIVLAPDYIDQAPSAYLPAAFVALAVAGLAVGTLLRALADRRVWLAVAVAPIVGLTCLGAISEVKDWLYARSFQTSRMIVEVETALCGVLPEPLPADLSGAPWLPDWALRSDSWGRPLHYSPAEDRRSAIVASSGPDGAIGTDDDFTAHIPEDCDGTPR